MFEVVNIYFTYLMSSLNGFGIIKAHTQDSPDAVEHKQQNW